MGDLKQSYQNILVGIDGSNQSKNAFIKAIDVAKRNNGKIIAAFVAQNNMYDFLGYGNISEDLLQRAKKDQQFFLDNLAEKAQQADFENLETKIIYGNPKEILAKILPQENKIDLIMVGQSGLNNVERMMIGSVSQYVISHAPCDVMIIH